MSQGNNDFDVFDPTGMVKNMRDASIDSWAKIMVQLVNSEAYAEATGAMLDTWLSSSGPFRKVIENGMSQTLANLNLPSRAEITRIADRMTNIEIRLDDLDAKLDDALQSAGKSSKGKKKNKTGSEEDKK